MEQTASSDPARWFQPVEADPDAEVRLFLFPYAGGSASMYRDWGELFTRDVARQAVQLPGRLDRRAEPRYERIEPLIQVMGEAFAAELDDRPFAFFGHSAGALFAYRLALELEREYGRTPSLLAAAGWAPEGFLMPTMEQIGLPEPEFVDWIVGLGSLPAALYQNPDVLAMNLPPTRADLLICANYVDDGAWLACPVVSYTGAGDPLMGSLDAASWAKRCPEYLGNLELPGGHFFIFDERIAITADFSRYLSRLHRSPAIAG